MPSGRARAVAVAASVAVAGSLGTLAVGAASGMSSAELAHLALLFVPGLLGAGAASAVAGLLLERASLRRRIVGIAVVSSLIGVGNLVLLTTLMVVSGHDAALIGVSLLSSLAAGVAAGLYLARASTAALDRVTETARALGEGRLEARVGSLRAGPEVETLARTLDDMAERLQRAIETERAVEDRRRDLMTAVSHDLRTPLAGLRAMVEAVDDGVVEDAPTLRRYAAEMRGAVDSLVALVDDLFELAQLDAGAIENEVERARLQDVVRSALASCEAQAVQKGLSMRADLDGANDAACSPRLVRVLQNLLQNAIRHTPADGTVRIQARRGPYGLQVAVQDSGEGIAPESLDRVFEPFWRGDPSRTEAGSGLGLALAKRIVEGLGGTIEVESHPAQGARFAVTVPE